MMTTMDNIQFPIELVNNDGTSMDDFPENPLKEKWDKLIPVKDGVQCSPILGKSETGSPIMNYGCVLCHDKTCHHSDSFIVPEEDKEIYDEYQRQCSEYNKLHGNV